MTSQRWPVTRTYDSARTYCKRLLRVILVDVVDRASFKIARSTEDSKDAFDRVESAHG